MVGRGDPKSKKGEKFNFEFLTKFDEYEHHSICLDEIRSNIIIFFHITQNIVDFFEKPILIFFVTLPLKSP